MDVNLAPNGTRYKSPSFLKGMELLSCTSGFGFPAHLHDRYVIWMNTGCGESFAVKGETEILDTGSISIIAPGVIHSNTPCSPNTRHLKSFYIDDSLLSVIARGAGKRSPSPHFIADRTLCDPGLFERLSTLHSLIFASKDLLELQCLATEALTELVVKYGEGRAAWVSNASCDHRVATIIDYMRANLSAPVSLDALKSLVNLTEFHIIRIFKKETGLSPHAFLIQLRLEHARTLLSQGESISQAALAAGFSDQSHLTRKFCTRFGISPGNYVKQSVGYKRLYSN
ncbi:MAG: AraC family transcriptional regulator [Desulfobacteraceae bacterium]|nr:AraC family transcriptional regulator [Desulfobacteraceae bacterium]